MSKEQRLQLHQFEVNKDNIIKRDIFVYSWPEKLMKLVLGTNDNNKLDYAISNLSGIITLAIDNIVYTRNKIVRKQENLSDKYWIFSLEEISRDTVMSLIREWLIESDIKTLSAEDLKIGDPIKITTSDLFEEPYKADVYGAIPQLYNFEFCREKVTMTSLGDKELDFLPVIATERKAAAISSTFDLEYSKNKVERFSYTINISLVKNREFLDKLFINIYIGIKVWACIPLIDIEKSKNYIKGGKSSSVYLYKENEYINNRRKKLIELMYRRDGKNYFKYSSVAETIFSKQLEFNLLGALDNPNNFNDFSNSDEIILVTNNKNTERVKYGAGLPERIELFNIFRTRFADLAVRELIGAVQSKIKPVRKDKKSLKEIKRISDGFDELKYIDINNDKLFYEIPPVFIPCNDKADNNKIIIEIYSNNQILIDTIIEYAVNILSLNLPTGKYCYSSCDGYEVEFIPKNAYICRGLSESEQKDNNLRKNEIKELLEKDNYISKNVISLIDIEAFHTSNATKSIDPKSTIRSVFKSKGRITQFINGLNTHDSKAKHRMANSLYDLLLAVGFMDNGYFKHGYNTQILLGLSTSINSNGKLIVLSKIDKGQIRYKIFGLSDEEWLPFNELLPKLNSYNLNKIKDLDKNRKIIFNQWIIDQLNGLDEDTRECLFYFDASLTNNHWSFAMNGDLNIEKLKLVNPERFKFIRVNTTDDVPEYNIFKNEKDLEGINKRQGLFSNDNHVFYSVGERPETMQVSKYATKVDISTKMIAKQKIVEFVVLNDDKEKNMELAAKSHGLRRTILTYDYFTKYPLPIYVNNRFGEYLEYENSNK